MKDDARAHLRVGGGIPRRQVLKIGASTALASAALPILAACGATKTSASAKGGGKNLSGQTVTIATVSNPQMTNMQKLVSDFNSKTGIKTTFLTLNEIDLRNKIQQDVALGAGKFDVLMISNYETPLYAANKWLEPLDPHISALSKADQSQFDLQDILDVWRTSLAYQNKLYSLPFYGESSMMFYRTDLFEQNHLTMPSNPTWDQIKQFAQKLNAPSHSGIVLRGEPGWGANMAPFDTVINTFGGRWFNQNWQPQLTSPQVKNAAAFYAMMVQKYGQSGATSDNFPECEQVFSSGKGAMWYDATSAAGYLTTPSTSTVAKNVGFAHAPVDVTPHGSHWLYSWSLAIEQASKHKDAAFQFVKWATSKDMVQMMGKKYGWENVPPGTRTSTYKSTPYGKKPWASLELDAIENADPQHPTAQPVPYTGIQFIDIPEFESLGDQVGRDLASLLAGKVSVDGFCQEAQQATLTVAKQGKYLKS